MSRRTISGLAMTLVVAGCATSSPSPLSSAAASPNSTVPTTATAQPTLAPFPPARNVVADIIALTADNPGGTYLEATADAIWVGGSDRLHEIDPETNSVIFEIPTTNEPRRFAIAGGAAWIGDFDHSLVRRVELATGDETLTVATGANPEFVLGAFGSIWTTDHRGATLTRIDPVANRAVATIEDVGSKGPSGPQGIGAGPDRIWVGVPNSGSVYEIDPATNAVLRSIVAPGVVPCGPILVDVLIWVSACGESHDVSVFDPGAGTAVSIGLPGYAGAPVRIGDRIWVPAIGSGDPVLIGFSPTNGTILDVVALPKPAGIDSAVVAFGSLWLADSESGTVVRIPITELGG